MKKYFSFLPCAVAILIAGCTNDAVLDAPEQSQEKSTTVNFRSEAEAVTVAEEAVTLFGENSRASKTVANVAVVGSKASRSATADTLIYAVNYADEQGFALVSAVKSGDAILAYVPEGNYSDEEFEQYDNFSFFMNMAKNYVAGQKSLNSGFVPADIPVVTTETVNSLIKVKWGQENPEGMFCEYGSCGAAPVAAAQIMTVLKRPQTIALTYKGADMSEQDNEWDRIMAYSLGYISINPEIESDVVPKKIARICAQLGYRSTKYNPGYVKTNIAQFYNYLKSILGGDTVNPIESLTNITAFYNKMNSVPGMAIFHGTHYHYNSGDIDFEGNPVSSGDVCNYEDCDKDLLDNYWVVDGGQKQTTTFTVTLVGGEKETHVDIKYFYNINWGNYGVGNGLYSAGVFQPKSGGVPTDANYNQEVEYIYINK